MLLVLAIWLLCGIGAASIAQGRGASGCLWFGLGVLLGPLGLALAFTAGSQKECPHCRKKIHPEATKCPFCQSALEPSAPALVAAEVQVAQYCRNCGRPLLAGGRRCVSGGQPCAG